ncbi:MAG: hypothetical protein ACJA0U_003233 [Salibacteraceae bacterium]|jgi:hypothetical protein
MIALHLKRKISIRRRLANSFVEKLKIYLVIKPLQYLHGNGNQAEKLNELRSLPLSSIGNDIAKMLDERNLSLIPNFENHDLKHLILGYGMTSQDEIRMQAYLIGNGNSSIYSMLFFSSGLLFPSEWKEYREDYRKGKLSVSILKLTLDDCQLEDTELIRSQYNRLKSHKSILKSKNTIQ